MTFFGMLVFFIASQMSMFSEAFPELKEKFNELLSMIVSWVSSEFNISTSNINSWIKQTKQDAVENSNLLIGRTLTTVSGLLIVILLLPVYIFMLLFYKPLLLEFIKKLFHRTEHGTVAEVLVESKTVIQSYLIGLLIETAIVAALNAIGLLILELTMQYCLVLLEPC
jgi:predicted PurR-regulated permease PerM